MPGQDDYTDDYVAELLKKDARATSSAASNLGLGSLLTKRPTGAAPKPNTRFLKNLIRDTDTHNAALLAKEAEESRARLRRLREEEQKAKGKPERQFYSARSRHDGTSGPPAKRRRLSDEEHGRSGKGEKRQGRGEEASRSHRSRDEGEAKSRRRRDRSRSRNVDDDREKERATERRHEHDRHRRRRTRSPEGNREKAERSQHRSHRHRSRSPSRHRDRPSQRPRYSSSPDTADRRKSAKHSTEHQNEARLDERAQRRHSPQSDSDPLEAIIGPPPPPAQAPVRSKGRGVLNRSSAIDSHFADTYDPSADVALYAATVVEEADDWDGALEALRDRQKWRQQGAERLRAAGFSEAEVDKWAKQKTNAKGEREMDDADVKWGKRGEGREWDRGKVVDEGDGSVDVKPEWGRLKGV